MYNTFYIPIYMIVVIGHFLQQSAWFFFQRVIFDFLDNFLSELLSKIDIKLCGTNVITLDDINLKINKY